MFTLLSWDWDFPIIFSPICLCCLCNEPCCQSATCRWSLGASPPPVQPRVIPLIPILIFTVLQMRGNCQRSATNASPIQIPIVLVNKYPRWNFLNSREAPWHFPIRPIERWTTEIASHTDQQVTHHHTNNLMYHSPTMFKWRMFLEMKQQILIAGHLERRYWAGWYSLLCCEKWRVAEELS